MKEELNEELKVINLEDYYSEDNEREGVWASPEDIDVDCPFEFLLTGANDPRNVAYAERYSKKLDELEDIKDLEEKAEKRKDLDAERIADFVQGMRPKTGYKLTVGKEDFVYSKPYIIKFFRKSPLIQNWAFRFVYKTANFIGRKKDSLN